MLPLTKLVSVLLVTTVFLETTTPLLIFLTLPRLLVVNVLLVVTALSVLVVNVDAHALLVLSGEALEVKTSLSANLALLDTTVNLKVMFSQLVMVSVLLVSTALVDLHNLLILNTSALLVLIVVLVLPLLLLATAVLTILLLVKLLALLALTTTSVLKTPFLPPNASTVTTALKVSTILSSVPTEPTRLILLVL